MRTGYQAREGAVLIVARLLRDPQNWPSIQRDSELLAQRVAAGLRVRLAREQLAFYFERLERRAA